jgi:general secretion pathway protein H
MTMPANFPQRSARQLQHGFTLLELLVVVVIVAILFTYTTLAIRSNSPEDQIKEEAYRLEHLIQLALEEAILRGEEYGIEVHLDGYRFLHFTENQWQPLDQDKILHERILPQDMELEMHLEETEIVINLVTEPMSDNEVALEQTAADEQKTDKKQAEIKPHIFLLSSGEITPDFDIRFYILGVKTSYFVRGSFDGSLLTEISDL